VRSGHGNGCGTCGSLVDETSWGDGCHSRYPPEALKRLTRLNDRHYRCPECGAYFVLSEGGDYVATIELTNWTLRRAAAGTPWVEVHELIRRGDFPTLVSRLLCAEDAAIRNEAAETLEAGIVAGFDISPLVPPLQEIIDGGRGPAPLAARLLMRHRLRRGSVSDLEALLRGRAGDVTLEALGAIQSDPAFQRVDWLPSIRDVLGLVRPFLASDEATLRAAATDLVVELGLTREEGESTVADAIHRLDSPRSFERAAAASILAQAVTSARGGADIRVAVPRLRQLSREARDDEQRQEEAESAEGSLRAASIWLQEPGLWLDHVGGAAGLAERLRRLRSKDDVDTLSQMRDRGDDIAPAFAALAEIAGPWALGLLVRAAAGGDDLSSAVRALMDLVAKAETTPGSTDRVREGKATLADVRVVEEGRLAMGILACHHFFRESWNDVDLLRERNAALFRAGVAEIIRVGLRNVVVPSKVFAHDVRRQRAASAMAFLLLFDDGPAPLYKRRPDKVSDLLESPSADVVSGAIFGLLQAVRAGRAREVEPFLGRLRRLRTDPTVTAILEAFGETRS